MIIFRSDLKRFIRLLNLHFEYLKNENEKLEVWKEKGINSAIEDDLEPVKKIMAAKKNTMFQNYSKNSNGAGVKQK